MAAKIPVSEADKQKSYYKYYERDTIEIFYAIQIGYQFINIFVGIKICRIVVI